MLQELEVLKLVCHRLEQGRDTSPEIAKKMCEMMQKKSPFERLKMGCSMYATSRFLVIRAILEHNPNISKTDLRKEFFLKFYGNDFSPVQRDKIMKHLEKSEIFQLGLLENC